MAQNSTKNRICFVSNYSKTYLFEAIGQILSKQNYDVYWIVVNKKYYKYLLKNHNKDNVLYLSKLNAKIPRNKIGEYKLNEIIIGDRVLRHQWEWAAKYLLNIQEPIYNFIKDNQISTIIGEITWGHEILIQRIVNTHPELYCKFLYPADIRIPNGRFAFFMDEFQNKIFERKDLSKVIADDNDYEIKLEKPNYLAKNDAIVKNSMKISSRINRFKRFISLENIEKDDPTLLYNRWYSLKINAKEELNKELYKLLKKEKIEYLNNKRFILYALHKQPENSIDVMGRYYEDQYLNIKNIWRILPDDWYLVVKEHTNAIGDRGLLFYRNIKKLRNTIIIDEKTNSYDLIRKSELVVTVSGTIAYEAALLNKYSITFAPVYFNKFKYCRNISLNDLKYCKNIWDLLRPNINVDLHPAKYIYENSYEGLISDPITNKECMDIQNLQKIVFAINEVYQERNN